jgi:DNA repair exonuclease SbcCD nuclease subunit
VAVDRRADFVLICGDLFDSRKPPPSVVSRAVLVFNEFKHVPIFILPGTHDFLSRDAILSPERTGWAPAHVQILNDPESSPFHIDDLNVYIYFRPNTTNRSGKSPIAGLKRSTESGMHIGLAHGSLKAGNMFSDDYPIDTAEIGNTELDYMALGHWHSPRIQSYGKTVAAYSGIPQPLSYSDPEMGSILYITYISSLGCETEHVETSTIRLRKVTATIYHPQEVRKLIDYDPEINTILKLDLKYSDNCTERLEIDRIIENAKSRYILVQEENQRQSQPAGTPASAGDINQNLIDTFTSELERLREADSPERAAIYEKALELGTKIIKGDI